MVVDRCNRIDSCCIRSCMVLCIQENSNGSSFPSGIANSKGSSFPNGIANSKGSSFPSGIANSKGSSFPNSNDLSFPNTKCSYFPNTKCSYFPNTNSFTTGKWSFIKYDISDFKWVYNECSNDIHSECGYS